MAKKSLIRNVKVVRLALREWANTVLTPLPLNALEQLARNQIAIGSFEKLQLWMDSTEFRMTGKNSMSTKDRNWSYKVNGPGRKWLFLHDARGRVMMVFGPKPPKTYDSHFSLRVADVVL